MSFNELEFVDWLSRRVADSPILRQGIGDDMGILNFDGRKLLFSSDLLLDGVHFDTQTQPMDLIGRKALACSLSDCAAMAVRPRAVTVSVAFSSAFSMDGARSLYEGIFALAEEFGVAVAGGDTTKWGKCGESLAIDVAIVATPWDSVQPVLRSGARAGDRLYVTGPLGGSLWSKHLRFVPRVAEAKAIAEVFGAQLHAMIDITDGLSLDLWRMGSASGVGGVLDEKMLESVISADAKRMAGEDQATPLAHALHDGEDFELLLAVEGDAGVYDGPLFEVGAIAKSGHRLRRTDGKVEALERKGFVH